MHFSASVDSPTQSLPPFTGFGESHFLDLDRVPMPHDFEQEFHGAQLPQSPSNFSSKKGNSLFYVKCNQTLVCK